MCITVRKSAKPVSKEHPTLWKWFQSYLSCRSQRVILNHCLSDLLPVLSGVPQGSILGPLLFMIFVNDLIDPVKHSNMFLYADDTTCFRKVSSVADCVLFQEDLCQLSSWSQKWNLHFNGHICVLVRFHSNLSCISYNYKIPMSQYKPSLVAGTLALSCLQICHGVLTSNRSLLGLTKPWPHTAVFQYCPLYFSKKIFTFHLFGLNFPMVLKSGDLI